MDSALKLRRKTCKQSFFPATGIAVPIKIRLDHEKRENKIV